jgi:hypothetical protein
MSLNCVNDPLIQERESVCVCAGNALTKIDVVGTDQVAVFGEYQIRFNQISTYSEKFIELKL